MTLRALILFLAVCLPAQAQVFDEFSSPPSLYSRAYLLVDLQSGATLVQKNADERIEPASLTKLMTAYVTFRAIKSGEISDGSPVVISTAAARQPASRMGI